MKIGFNLLLWNTYIEESQFHLLKTLKDVGYDGVEVPMFQGQPDDYRKIGQAIKDNGLEATGVLIMPDTDHDGISADPAAQKGARDHVKWGVDCASAFGGKVVGGPIHQALGHFSGGERTDEEWARGVEFTREVADYAQTASIALSIEPLNRFECYFLNLADDAAAYIKEVERSNVGFLYDTFHANIEEKHPIGALRKNIASINHVHVSANDRGTPGKDHIDWASTFAVLKENGYDQWLTIEAFGRALPDLAAATRIWRDVSASQEEVYTFGYQLIRNGWDNV